MIYGLRLISKCLNTEVMMLYVPEECLRTEVHAANSS